MIPFPDISPNVFAVEIGGIELALRWYALAYIVGIAIGWWIALRAVARPALWPAATPPATRAQLEDLVTWIVLGIIAGGRLGYVLFYAPDLLTQPLRAVAIWDGGMSFHGGFAGVCLAVLLFARRHGAPLASLADMLALAAPPGILLGRLANFVNAELWGRPTDLPWGVAFPGLAAQDCPGVEGVCARHPSQLYEAGLEGLLLGALLLTGAFAWGWLRAPWRVTGAFLAVYGAARFAVELARQPDAQFTSPDNPVGYALPLGDWGLTMGQLLSLPMIAVGLWLLWRARSATPRPARA
ncbi:MAG: prolipoprotein diacylglyceryl transferase [Paracoccaceae bacterium]